jgi:hypothetical protein
VSAAQNLWDTRSAFAAAHGGFQCGKAPRKSLSVNTIRVLAAHRGEYA